MPALIIPYDQLSPESLHGVIEEFVTRDESETCNILRSDDPILKMIEK